MNLNKAVAAASLAGTETLTNKRVTPRILSAASYTTDTGTSLNCDNLDEFIVTAQAGALLFNNPTGTPTDGQVLRIAVTGTAARALTYGTQFEASGGVALPTTTVTTARLDMTFVWRADTSKWHIVLATVAAAAGGSESYVYVREEQVANTEGGTFTSGAQRTRVLNTEVSDAGAVATLASNQVTLAAGTYRFAARAPAFATNGHKAQVVNITAASAILAAGTSAFSPAAAADVTISFVSGRFTIASAAAIELQHICETTRATDGFGKANNLGSNEVYAEIEFWKEL